MGKPARDGEAEDGDVLSGHFNDCHAAVGQRPESCRARGSHIAPASFACSDNDIRGCGRNACFMRPFVHLQHLALQGL